MAQLNSLVVRRVNIFCELKVNPYFKILFCYKKEGWRRWKRRAVRSFVYKMFPKLGNKAKGGVECSFNDVCRHCETCLLKDELILYKSDVQ